MKPASIRLLFLANASAVHAQRWIGYFRSRGYQTRWLSLENVPPEVEADKLPSRAWPKAVAILLSIPRIRTEIRRFKPHVVNALFVPNYGWAGALAGSHPLVVSAWGSDVLVSPRKSALHRRRVSWTIRKADLLFADAMVITERMAELGAAREKIVTVPLGVDPALLDRPRAAHEKPSVYTVVTNRRFESLYRNEDFVEAGIRLTGENSQAFRFELIGDGPLREGSMRRVREAGMTEVIRFQTFLPADELYRTLCGADIFVSCSESDGTSVSLLEAMALGLYPIVTDIPANREWITDRVNGRLFPVGDARSLAEVIRDVAAGRETWPDVQRRNREVISARALWPENMAMVEQAMMKLVR